MPAMWRMLVIGPGKAGRALARVMVLAPTANVTCIGLVGRTAESAAAAATWWRTTDTILGDPTLAVVPSVAIDALPTEWMARANFLLVATPDDHLAPVAAELAARCASPVPSRGVAWHCSGAASSDVLAPLRAVGFSVASMHPLKSFAEPLSAAKTFAGTPCCIEGDAEAQAALQALATAIGGVPFAIPTAGKTAYHAAATMASNYLVTLAHLATELLDRIGVERKMALDDLLLPLMAGTLDNLRRHGLPNALTGPIQRGDTATVRAHLAVLATIAPEMENLYRQLGTATVPIAEAAGLSDASAKAVAAALRAEFPAPPE